MAPLLLLDVDGVLNALSHDHPAWPRWERGEASAAGRDWAIRWSPDVVDAVRRWAGDGLADVRWLTTWGHDAPRGLSALLGLPAWEVAATVGDTRGIGPGDPAAVSGAPHDSAALAGSTPAAPDPLTGLWWKFDAVRRTVAEHPGRPLVWIDDDLAGLVDVQLWVRGNADALMVAPDPRSGLAAQDLDEVERFLRARV